MNSLEKIKKKIISNWDDLPRVLNEWEKEKRKIVFTNGCFDLIHRGHLELLAQASGLGDKFIVGLNTDASVKKLKGQGRPLQDEYARSLVMAGFGFVDLVVLFPQDTPLELIRIIKPGVLVKGGDYKAEEIVGYDVVTENNGQVVTINFVEGYSTTSIVNKIKD